MNQSFSCPACTKDILPEDHQYHTYIKKVVRHRSRQSGIRRITTPAFESEELMEALLGKEQLRKLEARLTKISWENRNYLMRPNLIFGILRSYVEHEMDTLPKPVELYAFQKAYFKHPEKDYEFDSYAVTVIGEEDPVLDAQLIKLALIISNDLKISRKLSLYLNTLGCPNCLSKYENDLEQYYYGKEHSMCESCKENLTSGDLLDLLLCAEEDCQILAKMAPKMSSYLCKSCSEHHQRLQAFLQGLEIDYELNPTLLPNINFYRGSYFEFKAGEKTILRGGRFNHLLEKLSGKSTPALGFELYIPALVTL